MSDIQTDTNSKVTLIALTLNEIDGVKAIMPQIDPKWVDQIIIADGGSTDGTIEWCREQGYEVIIQQKKGIRNAYYEVWPHVIGDLVISLSPDGNCPPEAVPKLIDKLREGNDLVIGSRYFEDAHSDDDDLITGFGNWMFTKMINILHGGHFSDAFVIYRAFRKQIVTDLDLDKDSSFEIPERWFNTQVSWEPLMSIRAAKRRLKCADVAVGEPVRIGGERKLQVIRWGLVFLYQTLSEVVVWRKSAKL